MKGMEAISIHGICIMTIYTILVQISNAPADILHCTAFLFLNYLICRKNENEQNKMFFAEFIFIQTLCHKTTSMYRYPTTEKSQHRKACECPLARIRARYLPITEFT
jgi:hypothetical protein